MMRRKVLHSAREITHHISEGNINLRAYSRVGWAEDAEKRFDMSLECSNKRPISCHIKNRGESFQPHHQIRNYWLAGIVSFHVFLLFAPISVASVEHDLFRYNADKMGPLRIPCLRKLGACNILTIFDVIGTRKRLCVLAYVHSNRSARASSRTMSA
jgi:hypothetical protein